MGCVWCVCFGLCLCVLRHAENPVCPFKTLPVCILKTSLCTGSTRTCVQTCARDTGTHGDVLNVHTGTF